MLRASERGKRTRGKHVPFLIEREKSLRHVAMVAKFLDLNKPKSCKVGGHNLPLLVPRFPASRFCPFVSRLPPFIVFLLSSCKSRCLTPYFNRECFGLVQNKKWCYKSNHFALSSAVIEAAFLRHNFTPRSKIFNVL